MEFMEAGQSEDLFSLGVVSHADCATVLVGFLDTFETFIYPVSRAR
jgi:hypothetical protein